MSALYSNSLSGTHTHTHTDNSNKHIHNTGVVWGEISEWGKDGLVTCFLFDNFHRDLPSPLLTREHLMTFASIADIEALKEQVRSLNLLVLLLPEVNQRVLKVGGMVKGRHM